MISDNPQDIFGYKIEWTEFDMGVKGKSLEHYNQQTGFWGSAKPKKMTL